MGLLEEVLTCGYVVVVVLPCITLQREGEMMRIRTTSYQHTPQSVQNAKERHRRDYWIVRNFQDMIIFTYLNFSDLVTPYGHKHLANNNLAITGVSSVKLCSIYLGAIQLEMAKLSDLDLNIW